MTRQPHDQFAKQYLEELLSPLGRVEVSKEVADETRQVDVFFSPDSNMRENAQSLGLLGQMVTTSTLLEPFRNAPSRTEIRNCILKLFSIFAELQRKGKREKTELNEDELPRLWILATSISLHILESFDAKLELENWTEGIYFLSPSHRTAIVVINQLPITPDTLLLRLLGRGKTQSQAVRELLELPSGDSFRQNVMELLISWRVSVEINNLLESEDREVFMALSQSYLEWKEATKREGLQQGLQQGQRQIIENLMQVRFGELDESLIKVVDELLKLSPMESSRLLLESSREDLIRRFLSE
jgi:hypothetical protein